VENRFNPEVRKPASAFKKTLMVAAGMIAITSFTIGAACGINSLNHIDYNPLTEVSDQLMNNALTGSPLPRLVDVKAGIEGFIASVGVNKIPDQSYIIQTSKGMMYTIYDSDNKTKKIIYLPNNPAHTREVSPFFVYANSEEDLKSFQISSVTFGNVDDAHYGQLKCSSEIAIDYNGFSSVNPASKKHILRSNGNFVHLARVVTCTNSKGLTPIQGVINIYFPVNNGQLQPPSVLPSTNTLEAVDSTIKSMSTSISN